jgi:hypothetical protein
MAEHRAAHLVTHLPNPEFARRFLIDGTILWVLLRVGHFLVGALAADQLGPPTLAIGLPAAAALVTLTGALTLLDVLRRREGILLANLGVPLRAVVVTGAVPALIGEVVAAILSATVGN